jgi:predicted DNA-binding transcriptional regulator YafY
MITLIHGDTGLNAARLAEKCDTTERTIYRDLQVLMDAGIPLAHDAQSGGYTIRRDFFLRPVDLTLEEALALLMLADRVGATEQITHAADAGKAAEKLLAVLPRQLGAIVNEVMPRVAIALARATSEPVPDVYGAMRDAIVNRRALSCEYQSPNHKSDAKSDPFRFDPFGLYWGHRAWYVVGLHHGRNETRTLKLSRFTRCQSLDKPYFIPDDFSLDRHFGKAWRMVPSGTIHPITLHFTGAFAETVAETHWHDSQEVEWLDDGSIHLAFQVDGLEEIVWWIMGYGPHCRVIEPVELAERVSDLQRAAAEQCRH